MKILKNKIKNGLETFLKIKGRIGFYYDLEDKLYKSGKKLESEKALDKISSLYRMRLKTVETLITLLDKIFIDNNEQCIQVLNFKAYEKIEYVDRISSNEKLKKYFCLKLTNGAKQ